jgi:hypothetical protein
MLMQIADEVRLFLLSWVNGNNFDGIHDYPIWEQGEVVIVFNHSIK